MAVRADVENEARSADEAVASSEDELLVDCRPAFTLWKRHCAPAPAAPESRCVLVVQAEGGELHADDVREATQCILEQMKLCDKFSTLYDLTEGIQNLMGCGLHLLEFGREQRRLFADKQLHTAIVCPNEQTRNWVRWITSLIPSTVPVSIVKDSAEAWRLLLQAPSELRSLDDYGTEFSVPFFAKIFEAAS